MDKPKKRVKRDGGNEITIDMSKSDLSIHPSYSKHSQMPYNFVCKERYDRCFKEYNKQFLYELKMLDAMQSCAYDALRFHRHFAYTILWPPLHTGPEIQYVLDNMFKLTRKQEKRLIELMNNEQY